MFCEVYRVMARILKDLERLEKALSKSEYLLIVNDVTRAWLKNVRSVKIGCEDVPVNALVGTWEVLCELVEGGKDEGRDVQGG